MAFLKRLFGGGEEAGEAATAAAPSPEEQLEKLREEELREVTCNVRSRLLLKDL